MAAFSNESMVFSSAVFIPTPETIRQIMNRGFNMCNICRKQFVHHSRVKRGMACVSVRGRGGVMGCVRAIQR